MHICYVSCEKYSQRIMFHLIIPHTNLIPIGMVKSEAIGSESECESSKQQSKALTYCLSIRSHRL